MSHYLRGCIIETVCLFVLLLLQILRTNIDKQQILCTKCHSVENGHAKASNQREGTEKLMIANTDKESE